MITIAAFRWVPEFARGQVRDLRVRWALEEAGVPYRTRLLEQGDQDKPEYRALQPFGQVPLLEEDGLVLFESGAIVLHIGSRSEALLPQDPGSPWVAQWPPVQSSPAVSGGTMWPLLSTIFTSTCGWARPTVPTRRSSGSSAEVCVLTGLVSVMP